MSHEDGTKFSQYAGYPKEILSVVPASDDIPSSSFPSSLSILIDDDDDGEKNRGNGNGNGNGNGDDGEQGESSLVEIPLKRQKEKKRRVYLSFYTPSEMTNINYVKAKPIIGVFTFLAYVFALFSNAFIWLSKNFFYLSNALTVRATKDEKYPKANFSHVEISVGENTYYVKWGTRFSKMEGKKVSNVNYNVLCLILDEEDYVKVLEVCENAFLSGLGFNYIGSVANFVLPDEIKKRVFGNGSHRVDPNRKFCSEFISEALSLTKAFSDRFGSDSPGDSSKKISPSLVSPIKLFSIVVDYGKKNPFTVVRSGHGLKCESKTKNVVVSRKI